VESLTVIVYDLYTLDNAGHRFDNVIAQVVLFTSRRELTMNVCFKCQAIVFSCLIYFAGSWFQVYGVDVLWMGNSGPSDGVVYGSPTRLQ
jgi:hypothetical protein